MDEKIVTQRLMNIKTHFLGKLLNEEKKPFWARHKNGNIIYFRTRMQTVDLIAENILSDEFLKVYQNRH